MSGKGTVLLRADGSATLGMGHLMRVVALADGLVRHGRPAVLLVCEDPAARALLEQLDLHLEYLPADLPLHQDAELTCAAAERLGAEVIVTDICHTPALEDPAAVGAFHLALKRSGAIVVSFGGAAYVDASADVAISPYVGANRLAGSGQFGQRRLLGPDYFIFRQEFAEAAAMPRQIAPRADRLLITIGGSDPTGLTRLAVEALACIDAAHLGVRVVVGSGFSANYRGELEGMTLPLGGRIEWLVRPTRLADLMLWADLAITGDGLTKYETAVTGTPSIMLSRPDSPDFMNVEFARVGTTLHLRPQDYNDSNKLALAIDALRNDVRRREEMSRRGKHLFDGRGLERVLSAILNSNAYDGQQLRHV